MSVSEKKGFPPGVQAPPAQFMTAGPAATPYGPFPSAAAATYGAYAAQAQLYSPASQGPPPTYDQSLTHPVVGQQMYGVPTTAAASVYAQQYAAATGYPLTYPAYSHPQHLGYPSMPGYPGYPPGVQAAAPLRSTVIMPNGFEPGARFDGIAQPSIPPPPPGGAVSAAQLAAMAGHNIALGQKKSSFLGGSGEGGYTFW